MTLMLERHVPAHARRTPASRAAAERVVAGETLA
jgi:hypothetical protein